MAAHSSPARRLCVIFFLLSTATLPSAASTSDSSLCPIPSPAPKHLPDDENALQFLRLFQLNAGYFFGGEDIYFSKEDNASYVTRSFSLFPHSVDRTTDGTLLHVSATLTLTGGRSRHHIAGRSRRRYHYVGRHSVTFYLDGYHLSTSDELCMTGKGTYSPDDDGAIENLEAVVLKLRVPSRPSLSDPFITGRLKGASFSAISLVAYAEGDTYSYGAGAATCPSSQPSSARAARGALQALGATFSCARLKKHLVSSYKLQHGGGAHAAPPGSSSPQTGLPLQARRMHVGQVRCTKGGEVRAYAVLSNDTTMWRRLQPHPPFVPEQAMVVAEGRWDPARSMLCLRACPAVLLDSETPTVAVAVKECGIGMSFWFPGVWTIRDRSTVAGMVYNSSQAAGGAGVISVSSIETYSDRSNLSDVKYHYSYTMVDEAKKHYLALKDIQKKKVKESFIAPNYTYHDFEFHFYESKAMAVGNGDGYPVTIGSTMVYSDRLAADDSFSRNAVVDMEQQELVNVSYDIRRHVPPANWVRPNNLSYAVALEERQMTAEGVFDPRTGFLCMIACHELHGSTDCQVLVTVQFASLDGKVKGHGKGAISSLRDKTAGDPLFFETIDIVVYGMYAEQVLESVSRMDLESAMLVASTTLACAFAALQILHSKRRPEAAAATSVAMLVALALGSVAPLVLSSEALFLSRRRQYAVPTTPFQGYVPYELSQVMMRAPTLVALLLQLRLIQLALSARKAATDDAGRGRAEASAAAAAERRALWVCLPLYLAGGALTVVAHAVSARRAAGEEGYSSVAARLGPERPTLWEDLVSSGGLALDAFLLPQVVMNAFAAAGGGGGRAAGALSPWFYVGGTVVRAMPHAYDVVRARGYVPSLRPSYVYASPRDDRFGVAWDVVVLCGAALLAALVFLQQRVGSTAAPLFRSQRLGEYEMVSPESPL